MSLSILVFLEKKLTELNQQKVPRDYLLSIHSLERKCFGKLYQISFAKQMRFLNLW